MCMTNKVCLSSCSKTAFIYFLPWNSRRIFFFNDLTLTNTSHYTHRPTHTTLNLCLLKWSLMRCEQRTTTLSLPPLLLLLPPFSSSLSLTPESDGNRQTERQRHAASDRQIEVEGEKAMVELMGENKVFFLFHYSIPLSIIM